MFHKKSFRDRGDGWLLVVHKTAWVTLKNNSVTKKKAAKSTKLGYFKSYLKLLQGKLMSLSGT